MSDFYILGLYFKVLSLVFFFKNYQVFIEIEVID